MNTLGVEVLKDELRDRIVKHQNLLELLEQIYPHQFEIPAVLPVPAPTKPKKTGRKLVKTNKKGLEILDPACSPGSKICKKCGEVKALEEFPLHKECVDGHMGTCRKCTNAMASAHYHAKHPQKSDSKIPSSTGRQTDSGVFVKGFHCACGKSFMTKLVFDQHQEKCEAV
jgi:hypothetical protein